MNIRDFVNNNSSIVTILAVVVLVVALGVIVWNSRGPSRAGRITDVYFYDLNTGKVFIDASEKLPPIPVESGQTEMGNNAGVIARIFSCDDCENYEGMTAEQIEQTGAFIAQLEMYTPEALAQMEKARNSTDPVMPPMAPDMMMGGMLVMAPGGEGWIDKASPQAMNMLRDLATRCPAGSKLKACFPGR